MKYKVGDLVLLTKSDILSKLVLPRAGSYLIRKTHNKGTLTIANSMAVTDKVLNIRRLRPYHKEPK